jgi:hypothetical protein
VIVLRTVFLDFRGSNFCFILYIELSYSTGINRREEKHICETHIHPLEIFYCFARISMRYLHP